MFYITARAYKLCARGACTNPLLPPFYISIYLLYIPPGGRRAFIPRLSARGAHCVKCTVHVGKARRSPRLSILCSQNLSRARARRVCFANVCTSLYVFRGGAIYSRRGGRRSLAVCKGGAVQTRACSNVKRAVPPWARRVFNCVKCTVHVCKVRVYVRRVLYIVRAFARRMYYTLYVCKEARRALAKCQTRRGPCGL